jgi:hypothetical protein
MKLTGEDKKLLQELCLQNHVSFEKVSRLLETESEYEFKDRRTGIFNALRKTLDRKFK